LVASALGSAGDGGGDDSGRSFMRRRRRLLVATVLALAPAMLMTLYAVAKALRPGAGIRAGNYLELHEGMTEEEVETLFGCPAGNYGGTSPIFRLSMPPSAKRVIKTWVGYEVAVRVVFVDGRVATHEMRLAEPPVSWQDRLRRLLPW
jgi:hypothetical protein